MINFVMSALEYLTGPALGSYRVKGGMVIVTDDGEYTVTDIAPCMDDDGYTRLECTVTNNRAFTSVNVFTGHYSEHEDVLFA